MAIDLGPVVIDLASSPPHAAGGRTTSFSSSVHATLAEAAPDTALPLKEPGFLPGEAELLDVTLVKEPRELVVLTYEDSANGTSLVIVVTPLDASKKVTHFSIGETIEEATVLGKPAAVIRLEAHPKSPAQMTVVWVGEGVVYQAIGVGISRAELVKVAESL